MESGVEGEGTRTAPEEEDVAHQPPADLGCEESRAALFNPPAFSALLPLGPGNRPVTPESEKEYHSFFCSTMGYNFATHSKDALKVHAKRKHRPPCTQL